MLQEAHSTFCELDYVFLSDHLLDGRMALRLLATRLCGGCPARPKLERTGTRSFISAVDTKSDCTVSLVAGIIPRQLTFP